MTVPTLSDFIDKHTELILDNWEVFAKSIITNTITLVARDHAAGLLRAIVSDMKTPETADQQPDKSKDFSRQDVKNSDAELHGAALRVRSRDTALRRRCQNFGHSEQPLFAYGAIPAPTPCKVMLKG